MLNYIDALNFNSNKFNISFFLKNKYKTKLTYSLKKLADSLYHYRSKHFKLKDSLLEDEKDCLKVIERENLCIIRFDDCIGRIQPQNVNLVAMLIHILEKVKSDVIKDKNIELPVDISGILSYCVLLT